MCELFSNPIILSLNDIIATLSERECHTVIACRLSNTATLDVLVVDYNDNEPRFSQRSYSGGELGIIIVL